MVIVREADWSSEMREVAALAKRLADRLMGVELSVRIVQTPNWFLACYCRTSDRTARMDLNLRWLGRRWFEQWQTELEPVLDLLLHELGHHFGESHLSQEYHRGITRLAAKLAVLVRDEPAILGSNAVRPSESR